MLIIRKMLLGYIFRKGKKYDMLVNKKVLYDYAKEGVHVAKILNNKPIQLIICWVCILIYK